MIRFRSAALSETGTVRADNQDSLLISPTGLAVADGVGGHAGGDVASAVLILRLSAILSALHPNADHTAELLQIVRIANWDIGLFMRQNPALAGMSTTFTGVFVQGTNVNVAHIGDSRAYVLQNGRLRQVTRDQSYVQRLVDVGVITPEQAKVHPNRNVITGSLRGDPGDGEELVISVERAHANDRWMLASDGLTDYVHDNDIAETLRSSPTPNLAARALLDAAYGAGTRDNVSVIVADVEDVPGEPEATTGSVKYLGAAERHISRLMPDL